MIFEQALWGALAAGREKERELSSTSLEFEYLHLKLNKFTSFKVPFSNGFKPKVANPLLGPPVSSKNSTKIWVVMLLFGDLLRRRDRWHS